MFMASLCESYPSLRDETRMLIMRLASGNVVLYFPIIFMQMMGVYEAVRRT